MSVLRTNGPLVMYSTNIGTNLTPGPSSTNIGTNSSQGPSSSSTNIGANPQVEFSLQSGPNSPRYSGLCVCIIPIFARAIK